jgi:hypothetical protein
MAHGDLDASSLIPWKCDGSCRWVGVELTAELASFAFLILVFETVAGGFVFLFALSCTVGFRAGSHCGARFNYYGCDIKRSGRSVRHSE